ncbi:MAG: hypothetical protein H0W08_08340 [Acidobacteria bacterium]|nr:hypothetical protein [Acidobacteriota bacterium]
MEDDAAGQVYAFAIMSVFIVRTIAERPMAPWRRQSQMMRALTRRAALLSFELPWANVSTPESFACGMMRAITCLEMRIVYAD